MKQQQQQQKLHGIFGAVQWNHVREPSQPYHYIVCILKYYGKTKRENRLLKKHTHKNIQNLHTHTHSAHTAHIQLVRLWMCIITVCALCWLCIMYTSSTTYTNIFAHTIRLCTLYTIIIHHKIVINMNTRATNTQRRRIYAVCRSQRETERHATNKYTNEWMNEWMHAAARTLTTTRHNGNHISTEFVENFERWLGCLLINVHGKMNNFKYIHLLLLLLVP